MELEVGVNPSLMSAYGFFLLVYHSDPAQIILPQFTRVYLEFILYMMTTHDTDDFDQPQLLYITLEYLIFLCHGESASALHHAGSGYRPSSDACRVPASRNGSPHPGSHC